MNCINCNNEIPAARLKILPSTKTCVKCSEADKVRGFSIISGKNTYSEIQIVSEKVSKELLRLQNRKGYGVSNGVKFDSHNELYNK
jgi:hypothetical protein